MTDMELLIAGCAVTAVFGMGVYVRLRQLFTNQSSTERSVTRANTASAPQQIRQVL